MCAKSIFVSSIKNMNTFRRNLTQFTALLRINSAAAKSCTLTEHTGLGKTVCIALPAVRTGLGVQVA